MKKQITIALLLVAGTAQAQSRLDLIQQQQTLRVCTTGDYKPYSFLRSDGKYEGLDISMVESLAASLGARVAWVPTTWKTMSDDFVAKQCDIALGGVSVNRSR